MMREEEARGYASSVTVSSVQTGRVSADIADNNNDDLRQRMEAQEQTSRAQQEALDNIQQMLAQLLTNWNNNDTGSNHNEEEHNDAQRLFEHIYCINIITFLHIFYIKSLQIHLS